MEAHRSSGPDLSLTHPSDNPNVFDDEYAVNTPNSDTDFHMADGFAAASAPPRDADSPAQRTLVSSSSAAAARLSDVKLPPAASRSSIQKNPAALGGFPASNDRSSTPVSAHMGVPTPLADLAHRSSSRASSYAPTDRASSPPQSGPSFPYGLYQQSSTGVGRTPSIATTSTSQVAGTRQSVLPTGPAHPYGLYRQNGLEEGEASLPATQQAIPVGFPGQDSGFHRQIGPDGEEQDIIGPDGHTEQLPPYSRYPEEGSAKVAVPNDSPSQESLARSPSSPQQASPSAATSSAAILGPTPGESGQEEDRRWNEKSWKERRTAKVCGGRLPCWVVGVLVGCAVVIAGLVAGLVGGLMATNNKKHHNNNSSSSSNPMSSFVDASAIAAPTNLPPPPAGSWALNLGIAEEQQSGCLTDPSQINAWTCSTPGPPLLLNVTAAGPGHQTPGTALLADMNPSDGTFNYGVQPPVMQISDLEWVVDLDDKRLGPALHFQAMYDKVVIVSEDEFGGSDNGPSKLRRRDSSSSSSSSSSSDSDSNSGRGPPPFLGGGSGPGPWGQKGTVQTGDQPWVCYWNQTFIEGFIYMKQNSSQAASQSAAFASFTSNSPIGNTPRPSASAGGTTTSSSPPSSTSAPSFSPPFSMSGFTPPSSIPSSLWPSWYSSVSLASASAATANGASASLRGRVVDTSALASSVALDASSKTVTSSPTPNPAGPSVYTVLATGSGTISATSYTIPTLTPLFPNIVKVEERRLSNMGSGGSTPKAQCVKMQLLDGVRLVPLPGPDNGHVIIVLSETDPKNSEFKDKDDNGKRRSRQRRRYRRLVDGTEVWYETALDRRDEPTDSCHCQWQNS